MATTAGFVRTKKNGTLTFKDGSGSNDIVTVTFEAADLTADLKAADFQPVHSRGVVQQFVEGDDPVYSGSITCHVTALLAQSAITNFEDLTQFEVAFGGNDSDVTTTGLAGEPVTVDVLLTLADPDGAGSETLTWGKCVFPSMSLSEGYPTSHTISWVGRVKPVIA